MSCDPSAFKVPIEYSASICSEIAEQLESLASGMGNSEYGRLCRHIIHEISLAIGLMGRTQSYCGIVSPQYLVHHLLDLRQRSYIQEEPELYKEPELYTKTELEIARDEAYQQGYQAGLGRASPTASTQARKLVIKTPK